VKVAKRNQATDSADVIVVGAGVVGAAVALALARDQRNFIWIAPFSNTAGSATRAAGAMLGALGEVTGAPAFQSDDVELELRVRAAALYPSWLDEIEECAGRRPRLGSGTFVVASSKRESDQVAMAAIEEAATRFKLPCERVDPSDVPGLHPAPGFEPHRVLVLPAEGFVDAPALHLALVEAVEQSGRATLVDDVVTKLAVDNGRVVGVCTTRSLRFAAAAVVLCAGAATHDIVEASDLAEVLPNIIPAKGASLILTAPSTGMEHQPWRYAIRTPNREFACGLHVVPRETLSLYVGATNRVSRFLGVTGDLTVSDALYLLDGVTKEFSTELEGWNIATTSFGYRPLSIDGLPIAGRTTVEGLSVGTGTYRNGVLLAPLLAELIVGEVTGASDPSNRLSPHHPDRSLSVGATSDVLREGLGEFARLVEDPGAAWWSGRLEDILVALGRLAGTDEQAERKRANIADLLTRYPRAEMVPEALIELLDDLEANGVEDLQARQAMPDD
jgi:glycine oxidase